ncbi:hypothetical protein ACFPIJ_00245 [Dactylosporangium cerinum]|uniref:Uncharacterized protein n=1 Tax=Dactylosporangium cerinum TaxID=1434730 RepID=A0ABV9VJV1_9ACTN
MTDGASPYAAFIEKELQREYDRRDSVNARASGLIVGASGLTGVTLLVAAILNGNDVVLRGYGAVALSVALVAFIVSGMLAVLAGLNWRFKVAAIRTLDAMLSDHWTDDATTAGNQCSYLNVRTTASLRNGTNIKFRLLLAAACLQLVALAGLALTAVQLMLD